MVGPGGLTSPVETNPCHHPYPAWPQGRAGPWAFVACCFGLAKCWFFWSFGFPVFQLWFYFLSFLPYLTPAGALYPWRRFADFFVFFFFFFFWASTHCTYLLLPYGWSCLLDFWWVWVCSSAGMFVGLPLGLSRYLPPTAYRVP